MEVKLISSSDTKSLRHRVLWPHIEKESDCIIDIDDREDSIHLGTFERQQLISVGSLFNMHSDKLDFKNQYRLRAMATDPDFRGMNAGKVLVEKGIQLLRQKKTEVLWCDARIGAEGFYKSLGFRVIDEIYEVPRIGPHKFMWFEL